MNRISQGAALAILITRRISRRRLCLMLLGLQLLGAFLIGLVWIVPEVTRTKECVERRKAELTRLSFERDRGDALRDMAAEIEGLHLEMTVFGSLSVDDARTHSLAREIADVSGLALTHFVAMEAEGTYLVTFKGAFANVVMLARRLETSFSAFRLRRFIARASQTPDDYLELELLIQKSPPFGEFATSCAIQRR